MIDNRYQQTVSSDTAMSDDMVANRSKILDLRSSSRNAANVIPGLIGNPVVIIAGDIKILPTSKRGAKR